jgi:hypothetical protein
MNDHPLAPALVMPLAAAVLLVCTTVVSLPVLLAAGVEARRPPAEAAHFRAPLLVARSARGRWFLDGQPIAAAALARLLASPAGSARSVRLLAGDGMTIAEVSHGLAWLRRHAGASVQLEPALLP